MDNPAVGNDWALLAEEVWTGLAEWRAQHPQASWREIERALDERLAGLRARLLQDLVLASTAADPPATAPAPCPRCGHPMQSGGYFIRHLTTHDDQDIVLDRQYTRCPVCGTGLFPPL